MIILIDNENFMIRLCKDTPEYHGFSTTFPHWQALARILSDIGEKVLLSGPVAEKFLDENNIYYVHVEAVAKESFFKFERRLQRLVRENQELIETSLSFGNLMLSVKEDGTAGTAFTDNLFEVWRLNEDNRYYIDICIDPLEEADEETVAIALEIEKVVAEELGCTTIQELQDLDYEVKNKMFSDLDSLLSADTYRDILINVLILCELAVM